MERLPTKCALAARNIPVQSQLCVFCGDYGEMSDHLFVSCQFAQVIWLNIAGWCLVPPVIAFGIRDILALHEIHPGSSKRKKALYAVILVTFWCIWKTRNEVVFGQVIRIRPVRYQFANLGFDSSFQFMFQSFNWCCNVVPICVLELQPVLQAYNVVPICVSELVLQYWPETMKKKNSGCRVSTLG
ncbi:uncharacterized protein LOC110892298 [Helianthus annuus]|uniref:uncharacterized protein LOC110892298 n=1 Tax=Helianthus annuus TaxID=4232 RepID=UPI000B8EF105|nr:uncharacterized protein LOC110892298 [Helianthus annuus]